MKHGYPFKNSDISSEYSKLDFDKDEEYSVYFHKVRAETLDSAKMAVNISPQVTYSFSLQWFSSVIKQPMNTGTDQELCNLMSPSYLEWDGMSLVS